MVSLADAAGRLPDSPKAETRHAMPGPPEITRRLYRPDRMGCCKLIVLQELARDSLVGLDPIPHFKLSLFSLSQAYGRMENWGIHERREMQGPLVGTTTIDLVHTKGCCGWYDDGSGLMRGELSVVYNHNSHVCIGHWITLVVRFVL